MSLKSTLNQIIKDRNGEIVTTDEIQRYCEIAKYKLSNAERRLRPSDSPNIESVWNDKETAIIGYKWKQGVPTYTVPSKSNPTKPHHVVDLTTTLVCDCFHYHTFGYCSHQKKAEEIKQATLI